MIRLTHHERQKMAKILRLRPGDDVYIVQCRLTKVTTALVDIGRVHPHRVRGLNYFKVDDQILGVTYLSEKAWKATRLLGEFTDAGVAARIDRIKSWTRGSD
jgi:hypothetical protein